MSRVVFGPQIYLAAVHLSSGIDVRSAQPSDAFLPAALAAARFDAWFDSAVSVGSSCSVGPSTLAQSDHMPSCNRW